MKSTFISNLFTQQRKICICLYCVINGVLLSTKRINFHSAAKERSPVPCVPFHIFRPKCSVPSVPVQGFSSMCSVPSVQFHVFCSTFQVFSSMCSVPQVRNQNSPRNDNAPYNSTDQTSLAASRYKGLLSKKPLSCPKCNTLTACIPDVCTQAPHSTMPPRAHSGIVLAQLACCGTPQVRRNLCPCILQRRHTHWLG